MTLDLRACRTTTGWWLVDGITHVVTGRLSWGQDYGYVLLVTSKVIDGTPTSHTLINLREWDGVQARTFTLLYAPVSQEKRWLFRRWNQHSQSEKILSLPQHIIAQEETRWRIFYE